MHAGGHRFDPVHLHHLILIRLESGRCSNASAMFIDNGRILGRRRKAGSGSKEKRVCVSEQVKEVRAYGGCLGIERR